MDIYKNIFDIDKFSFAYPDGNDESGRTYLPDALRDTELHVRQGEFVVILGKSGCGKTTLLRQLKPSVTPVGKKKGQIIFDGKDICSLDDRMAASQIGFVWQDVNAQLVTDKVWHELAFGLESLGYDNGYVRRRVAEMGSFFGLGDIFHRKVMDLSGGQKQRVWIAMALAQDADYILLDEPTTYLDIAHQLELMKTLRKLADDGKGVAAVMHDLPLAFSFSDRLHNGKGQLTFQTHTNQINHDIITRTDCSRDRSFSFFDQCLCISQPYIRTMRKP